MPTDICVVIPVLNEAARIAYAIESVVDAGQVIVVDGGSTDQTIEIAKSFSSVEIVQSRCGRGHQLREGAKGSKGKVLLFLHGDCRLAPSALAAIAAAIDDGHRWGGLRQRIDRGGLSYRLLEWGNAMRVKWLAMVFGDQALFVSAETYRQSGGFEAVPLMEDVRLSHRLRKLARPVFVDAEVIIDARRWQRRGIVRQTLLNWRIQFLHRLGVAPERLERLYR